MRSHFAPMIAAGTFLFGWGKGRFLANLQMVPDTYEYIVEFEAVAETLLPSVKAGGRKMDTELHNE